MKEALLSIAGLDCHVLESEKATPKIVVILCHGFGAPGQDLVPIGQDILLKSRVASAGARFVFPEAPLSLGGFGPYDSRAWWMIDTMALQDAMLRGEVIDRRNTCPEELPVLRKTMFTLIDELKKDTGLPTSKFVLGGFSQGAMLTTDVAAHLDDQPGALCVWSGTLLCESIWRSKLKDRSGLQVLQSHGRQDPLLPYAAAELLRDLFTESGLSVEFIPFDGPHTIPFKAMDRLGEIVESMLDSE